MTENKQLIELKTKDQISFSEMDLIDYERRIVKALHDKIWDHYLDAAKKYQLYDGCQWQKGFSKAMREVQDLIWNEFQKVNEAWNTTRETLSAAEKKLFPWGV